MSDSAAAYLEITRALKELADHRKKVNALASDSDDDDVDDFAREAKRSLDKIEKCLKHAKAAVS